MLLNTASQSIGAQMITAADGSAFTGAVTVAVTVDSGTQATGTVGSGACTHEGNGYHSYGPSQAETNGAHIAFTFTGSGAIPVTVQVFTRAGDAFTRLGLPAGASVSADIAAIEGQTDDIGAAGAGLTAVPWNAAWDAEVQSEVADALAVYDPPTNAEMEARTLVAASYGTAANQATIAGYIDTEVASILAAVDTEVAAIKAVTDLLPDAGALTSIATAANLTTVDTVVDAIKAKTDQLTFTVANQVDANAESMNATTILGTGVVGDKWRG